MRNVIGDKIRSFFGKSRSFRYTIGGKTYIQQPLVLGQIKQLIELLRGTVIPVNTGAVGVIFAIGDKISAAFAIVLTEEGADLDKKDLDGMARGFEFSVTPELAVEVFEDFLACNPLSSLLERIAGIAGVMGGMIQTATGSLNSASSSRTGTSPGATESSGA